jgi:hypothetical protein
LFAGDSTHIEVLTRTGNEVTWKTNEIGKIAIFHAANDIATICIIFLAPRDTVFSSVCDRNLILTADSHLYNG